MHSYVKKIRSYEFFNFLPLLFLSEECINFNFFFYQCVNVRFILGDSKIIWLFIIKL